MLHRAALLNIYALCNRLSLLYLIALHFPDDCCATMTNESELGEPRDASFETIKPTPGFLSAVDRIRRRLESFDVTHDRGFRVAIVAIVVAAAAPMAHADVDAASQGLIYVSHIGGLARSFVPPDFIWYISIRAPRRHAVPLLVARTRLCNVIMSQQDGNVTAAMLFRSIISGPRTK